jgi:hypothetical protein
MGTVKPTKEEILEPLLKAADLVRKLECTGNGGTDPTDPPDPGDPADDVLPGGTTYPGVQFQGMT